MIVGSRRTLSSGIQVLLTAIICCLVCFILGTLLGVLCHHCVIVRLRIHKLEQPSSSPAPPAASAPVVYEEVSPDALIIGRSNIELKENVAYGPI